MAAAEAVVPIRATDRQLEAGTARVLSIDAFRGFTMICMIGEGLGLLHFRNNPVIAPSAVQFQHVDWNMSISWDLHFWDLIQPFFMFIVGAVMPISFARRWAAGEPRTQPWSQTALVFTGWTGQRAIATLSVIAFEIHVCYWLYRRKIFFKI